jgi:hypothetical protein
MNKYKLPNFYESKKYGYKDIKSAKITINNLMNKHISQKIKIIDIMIKRAIYHPNRTYNMIKAINYYNNYLKILKKKSKLSILPKKIPKYFIKLAEYYKISFVARKVIQSSITNKTFLEIYPKVESELKKKTIRKDSCVTWYNFRRNILFRKFKNIDKWFHTEGTLSGLPTKEHVVFILWGYSPYKTQLENIYKKKLLKI